MRYLHSKREPATLQHFALTQALDDPDSQDINEPDENSNMDVSAQEVSHLEICPPPSLAFSPSSQVLAFPETQEVEESDAALARSMALGLRSKRSPPEK